MGQWKRQLEEEQDRLDEEAAKFPPCVECGHCEHPRDRNPNFPELCSGCAHFMERRQEE